MLTPEEIQQIHSLAAQPTWPLRKIARKFGRNIKTIRRILDRPPKTTSPSKLEPFKEAVQQKTKLGLKGPRILREIRQMGYTGSHTILGDFIRTIRPPRRRKIRIFRRFETPPAQEMQVDWSPFRILIGGVLQLVHCFALILAFSRRLFIGFYRDEKLPTLLHAHQEALNFMDGACHKSVYDNMGTVTSGRLKGLPIWNEQFLAFARHIGFTPYAHRPGDPNRKGKIEAVFPFIYHDFLLDALFDSWADLCARRLIWLSEINQRIHGTTRRVPEQVYLAEEHPLLIRLPQQPFPTYRPAVRCVQDDGTIPIDGSKYPVPNVRPGQTISARVFPHQVHILDSSGEIVVVHAVPDLPRRLAPPTPFFQNANPIAQPLSEGRFLERYPDCAAFLEGLKLRMKSLTHIHLRQIEKLALAYPPAAVQQALERAQAFRNFNAQAVARILRNTHPLIVPEIPSLPVTTNPASLGALDDIEVPSPDQYDLDSQDPSPEVETT